MIKPEEKRLDRRALSFARAVLELDRPLIAYVADVSPPGFRLRTLGLPSAVLPQVVRVGISFEARGIAYFPLHVTIAWQRVEEDSLVLGCAIQDFLDPKTHESWNSILKLYTQGELNGPCNEFIVDEG